MNEVELNEILGSDMKLWNLAETQEPEPGVVVKTLDLPYGIGREEVRLEGLHDANTKRNAVSAFAEHIRSLVKDRTDDEAVEARAKLRAADAEQRDMQNGIYVGTQGVPDTTTTTATVPITETALQEPAKEHVSFGDALIAQRTQLAERVGRLRIDLARCERELKALDAACAALEEDDAPTDSKTPE